MRRQILGLNEYVGRTASIMALEDEKRRLTERLATIEQRLAFERETRLHWRRAYFRKRKAELLAVVAARMK